MMKCEICGCEIKEVYVGFTRPKNKYHSILCIDCANKEFNEVNND